MKYTQGTPYVAPSNWHRGPAPCTCGGCPSCEDPEIVTGELLLDVDDNGKCFSGDGITVTMPDITTVEAGFCISFEGGYQSPSLFETYESNDGGGVEFVIDGFEYSTVSVAQPGGELCICYLDATHWAASGDVNGGPGGGT